MHSLRDRKQSTFGMVSLLSYEVGQMVELSFFGSWASFPAASGWQHNLQ